LLYYQAWFLGFLSHYNIVVLGYLSKLFYFGFEILNTYLVYLLSSELISKKKSIFVAFFYGNNPTSYFLGGFFGFQVSFLLALWLSSLIFFIRKKYGWSSILLGLCVSENLYPILALMFIIPALLKKKKILTCFLYSLGILCCYIIISLPILILNPIAFINAHFIMLQRYTSISIIPLEYRNHMNFPIYEGEFTFLNLRIPIDLSILDIYRIIIFLVLFLILLRINDSKIMLLRCAQLLFIFISLSGPSAHVRFIYLIIPEFVVFYFALSPQLNIENLNIQKKIYLWLYPVLSFVFSLISLIFIPTYSNFSTEFQDLQINFFLLFYGITLIIWFIISLKYPLNKESGIYYPIIGILYGFSFIFGFLSENRNFGVFFGIINMCFFFITTIISFYSLEKIWKQRNLVVLNSIESVE
jgi:hypothetical protein